jgi:hypothetical protein
LAPPDNALSLHCEGQGDKSQGARNYQKMPFHECFSAIYISKVILVQNEIIKNTG